MCGRPALPPKISHVDSGFRHRQAIAPPVFSRQFHVIGGGSDCCCDCACLDRSSVSPAGSFCAHPCMRRCGGLWVLSWRQAAKKHTYRYLQCRCNPYSGGGAKRTLWGWKSATCKRKSLQSFPAAGVDVMAMFAAVAFADRKWGNAGITHSARQRATTSIFCIECSLPLDCEARDCACEATCR